MSKCVARNTHGTPLKQCTVIIRICLKSITILHTFAAGLIQAVRAKTAGLHVALPGKVSATDPVKVSKDSASLVVCTRKKIRLRYPMVISIL